MWERVKSALKDGAKVCVKRRICAGFNKAVKLISRGEAEKVFLAADADEAIVSQIRALCRAASVALDGQYDKKALGKLCSIEVGCAVAVLVKEP